MLFTLAYFAVFLQKIVFIFILLSLIEFLAKTRLTAVFEILNPDHPHVEDLSALSS